MPTKVLTALGTLVITASASYSGMPTRWQAPNVSAATRDPLEDSLVSLAKQSWQAWQRGPALVAGVASHACVVHSFAVDSFDLTRLSASTAVLTCHATQETLWRGPPRAQPSVGQLALRSAWGTLAQCGLPADPSPSLGRMAEFALAESEWPPMPSDHHRFLAQAIPGLRGFPRLCGLGAGGSFISRALDAYSDLDLLVIVAEDASPLSMSDRWEIAAALGPLLACSTPSSPEACSDTPRSRRC